MIPTSYYTYSCSFLFVFAVDGLILINARKEDLVTLLTRAISTKINVIYTMKELMVLTHAAAWKEN